jgi:AP-1 complex subunit beta-1
VAPALLEELLGEVGSLASVYHKPSETFIGKGRIGADAVRKAGEYVFTGLFDILAIYHFSYPSLTEDQFSTQKALQTVVAGQQAENLLYVDYDVTFMEVPS